MAVYSAEGGLLTISDEDCRIDFSASFTPLLIEEKERWSAVGALLESVRYAGFTSAVGLRREGEWVGEYLFLYQSGAVKGRQFYHGGLLHGPSRMYTPQSGLLAEGWFISGKRVGKSMLYYPSGKLYSIQHYDINGWREGLHEYYYENGQVKTSMHCKAGRIEGSVLLYHADGALDRTLIFYQGKLISAIVEPPHKG